MASGSEDETVRLWDVQAGVEKQTFTERFDVYSVSFSPDGQTLASSVFWRGTVRLWDVQTGIEKQTFTGHTSSVYSVSFSPDGQTLASGGGSWRGDNNADNTVRLWDVQTGVERQTFTGHTSSVYSVNFSPDGQTVASGSEDETVRLWDVQTGIEKQILTGHTGDVYSVNFSPDGQIVASGSEDETVRLWDVQTGVEKQILTGHTDSINSVSFSPNGQIVASGSGNDAMRSGDNTVRLWDVQTGVEKQILTGHTDSINSVSFSPNEQTLASGSEDGIVLLWRVMLTEPTEASSEIASRSVDVNSDGTVNIQDLVLVAANLGKTGQNDEDVNSDGVVDIRDLVKVAGALGNGAAAPSLHPQSLEMLTAAEVKQWLSTAQHLDLTDAMSQRGILFLQQLLITLTPKETALLANFPNPFNPETWIPYQLSKEADVTLTIYAVNGRVVRQLALGHQPAGVYQARSRAAYWDGRNALGELVASGVYFYTLTADDFSATRKLLIQK